MKDFDQRWRLCAARARQAPARDEDVPVGFAARVVARAAGALAPPLAEVCQRLALRMLAGTLALLVICAILELPHFRDRQPWKPGIENTVAQLVWTL